MHGRWPVLLGGPAGETGARSMAGVIGRPSGRDGCTVDGRTQQKMFRNDLRNSAL